MLCLCYVDLGLFADVPLCSYQYSMPRFIAKYRSDRCLCTVFASYPSEFFTVENRPPRRLRCSMSTLVLYKGPSMSSRGAAFRVLRRFCSRCFLRSSASLRCSSSSRCSRSTPPFLRKSSKLKSSSSSSSSSSSLYQFLAPKITLHPGSSKQLHLCRD